jgi:hypothetical protein
MAQKNEGAGWVTEEDLVPASQWKLDAYRKNKDIALGASDFASTEAYRTFILSQQNAFLGVGEDALNRDSWVVGDGRLTPRAQAVLTGKADDPQENYEKFLVQLGREKRS